jgi:hypothetical protein
MATAWAPLANTLGTLVVGHGGLAFDNAERSRDPIGVAASRVTLNKMSVMAH